jgi:hypothetical protein
MDKLNAIVGVGSVAVTTGQIKVVLGVGAVANVQRTIGSGDVVPVKGNGGVNET